MPPGQSLTPFASSSTVFRAVAVPHNVGRFLNSRPSSSYEGEESPRRRFFSFVTRTSPCRHHYPRDSRNPHWRYGILACICLSFFSAGCYWYANGLQVWDKTRMYKGVLKDVSRQRKKLEKGEAGEDVETVLLVNSDYDKPDDYSDPRTLMYYMFNDTSWVEGRLKGALVSFAGMVLGYGRN